MTPEQELYGFYFYDLKWCGCGNPDEAMAFMRDVLAALDARSVNWDDAGPALRALLPLDSPMALSYLYFLDALDLTEHGGGVYGCWLTDKGKKLLGLLNRADLETFTDNDVAYIDMDDYRAALSAPGTHE